MTHSDLIALCCLVVLLMAAYKRIFATLRRPAPLVPVRGC